MYAIFNNGGKQYTAKVGDTLFLEKLEAPADTIVRFEEVLALGEEGSLTFGAPYVDGAFVAAKVIKNGKGKKITVMTYRPKKGSKRKLGHRQPYTKVEITGIETSGGSKPAKAAAAPAAVKTDAPAKKPAASKTAAPKAEAEKKAPVKKPAAPKAAAAKTETAKKAPAKKPAAPKAAAAKTETAKKAPAKKPAAPKAAKTDE